MLISTLDRYIKEAGDELELSRMLARLGHYSRFDRCEPTINVLADTVGESPCICGKSLT